MRTIDLVAIDVLHPALLTATQEAHEVLIIDFHIAKEGRLAQQLPPPRLQTIRSCFSAVLLLLGRPLPSVEFCCNQD